MPWVSNEGVVVFCFSKKCFLQFFCWMKCNDDVVCFLLYVFACNDWFVFFVVWLDCV